MKKGKLLRTSMLALAIFGTTAVMSGCGGGDEEEQIKLYFDFSCAIKSGRSILEMGKTDYVVVHDNGVDKAGRQYEFSSSDTSVATIDENGKITPVGPGQVNFRVKELKSDETKQLPAKLTIVDAASSANGGYNFAGAGTPEDLDRRAEILGKLEKYAMDTHLTGITLFDNGGFVKYSNRVKGIPREYITGYGFGLISEGRLEGTLKGGSTKWPDYYHTSLSQNSLTINQYTATGSQVSDLASYITSTYWSTKIDPNDDSNYVWYPVLAKDKVKVPKVDEHGDIISYAETETDNIRPIPMETKNELGLYRKWRIYVKTNGIKYHTTSSHLSAFNNREVNIKDYEFIYKFLLTGSNGLVRGTEMANDSSYGIKGAQRFNSETTRKTNIDEINNIWETMKDNNKLGIATGHDEVNGDYIDLELINAIDDFTAMYTLSSSLVSPLPEELFTGHYLGGETMADAAINYGKPNNGSILDYTLCCGPFELEEWSLQQIVFKRCDDWFECGERYHIPGIYYSIIDTSTDLTKTWKEFNAGKLDSTSIPTEEVKQQEGQENVYVTKGDSTFKLNVNACTQEQWDDINSKHWHNAKRYMVKPWMSNSNFVNGLFYSIDRKAFASKRGVTPSVSYFSDSYMADPQNGKSYNETSYHKEAVAGYESKPGEKDSDFGYNLDKAISSFRAAINELTEKGKLTLGSRENPAPVNIDIEWMYQSDIKEYGEDIASYFTTAFNNPAVCGGRAKLIVNQAAVTNWEDVYSKYLQKGNYDLAFGAISGNSFNPLNFMEVLKSDDSSGFTLNWGTDTSKIDDVHPIIYNGKKWSFDALWETADHGGIVQNGVKVKPIKKCEVIEHKNASTGDPQVELYEGYKGVIDLEFVDFNDATAGKVSFAPSKIDIYINNYGPYTIAEGENISYDKSTHELTFTVSQEEAEYVNTLIRKANGWETVTPGEKDAELHEHPFVLDSLGTNNLFTYELTYTIAIKDTVSESYVSVKY